MENENPTLKLIESNSLLLIKEFENHFEDVKKSRPGISIDRRLVYEAWILQKISAIQIVIKQLAEVLEEGNF